MFRRNIREKYAVSAKDDPNESGWYNLALKVDPLDPGIRRIASDYRKYQSFDELGSCWTAADLLSIWSLKNQAVADGSDLQEYYVELYTAVTAAFGLPASFLDVQERYGVLPLEVGMTCLHDLIEKRSSILLLLAAPSEGCFCNNDGHASEDETYQTIARRLEALVAVAATVLKMIDTAVFEIALDKGKAGKILKTRISLDLLRNEFKLPEAPGIESRTLTPSKFGYRF